MKLSEFNTNEAADVLCELSPFLGNIATDKELLDGIGKAIDTDKLSSKAEIYMETCRRIANITPILLKTHRADVFGVLGVLNKKTAEEIGRQPLRETVQQLKETFFDEEFVSFFVSLSPQEQNM